MVQDYFVTASYVRAKILFNGADKPVKKKKRKGKFKVLNSMFHKRWEGEFGQEEF